MKELTNEQLRAVGYGMMDRLMKDTNVQDTLYWMKYTLGDSDKLRWILEKAIAVGVENAMRGKTFPQAGPR